MAGDTPIRLVSTDDGRRTRITVLFRWLLSLPHWIWLMLWGVLAWLGLLASWLATLVMGRTPARLHDFLAAYVRYATWVNAYAYLMADPFPAFSTGSNSYPIDLQIDPPAPQRRLVTAFRMLLAIPALILSSILQQVLGVVSFLGWFAALVLGRMPQGLESLGLYCLRYMSKTNGYTYLLTDRYPSLGAAPGETPATPAVSA